MKKDSYHVVPYSEGGWAVRKSGSERVSRKFASQKAAVKCASDLSARYKTVLYVHRPDGSVKAKKDFGEILQVPGRIVTFSTKIGILGHWKHDLAI